MKRYVFWIVQREGAVKVSMELKCSKAKRLRGFKVDARKDKRMLFSDIIDASRKTSENDVRYAIVSDGIGTYVADIKEDSEGYNYKPFTREVAKALISGEKVRIVTENMPRNQVKRIVGILRERKMMP